MLSCIALKQMTEKMPATMICDNMVSFLMKRKNINAVIVGADRVAANGDTANKIGTYQVRLFPRRIFQPT